MYGVCLLPVLAYFKGEGYVCLPRVWICSLYMYWAIGFEYPVYDVLRYLNNKEITRTMHSLSDILYIV